MKKILVLAANPRKTQHLRLDQEVKEIENALQLSSFRHQFTLTSKWAVQPEDLRRALLTIRPQIVHFCGHGEGESGIALENDTGNTQLVGAEALASLFKIFEEDVECVLLNACYAKVQAEAISQHIDFVIGMNQAITDTAAIDFSVGFYDALGEGMSFEKAHELGCNAIQLKANPVNSSSRKAVVVESGQQNYQAAHIIPVLLKKVDVVNNEQLAATDPGMSLETFQATEKATVERMAQIEAQITSLSQQMQPEKTLDQALKWLEKRHSLAQKACDQVLQTISDTKDWSDDDKEEFYCEIEQYLEYLYYSLLTGKDDLLDEPPIMPVNDYPQAYKAAFDWIKGRILPSIDPASKETIKNKLDYLLTRLF